MPRPVKLYVASEGGGHEKGWISTRGGGGERNVCGALAVYTAVVRARKQSSWRMRARKKGEGRKTKGGRGLYTRETRPAKSFSRAASDSRYNFGPEET